jgi:hypothetical protein
VNLIQLTRTQGQFSCIGSPQLTVSGRGLTTSTFDFMKSEPSLGRAEALRRAMLAYINDGSDPRNAIRPTGRRSWWWVKGPRDKATTMSEDSAYSPILSVKADVPARQPSAISRQCTPYRITMTMQ